MRYSFYIKYNGLIWHHDLLIDDYNYICHDGLVILNIWKVSNFKYGLQGFFYNTKYIYDTHYFRTKSELYGAVHKLLQEKLYIDVQ